jgi:hypothetical protein
MDSQSRDARKTEDEESSTLTKKQKRKRRKLQRKQEQQKRKREAHSNPVEEPEGNAESKTIPEQSTKSRKKSKNDSLKEEAKPKRGIEKEDSSGAEINHKEKPTAASKPTPPRASVAGPKESSVEATSTADTKNHDNTRPRYSFQVDDTDHCETPLEAYLHLTDLLDQVAKSLGKSRSNLSIYDPYYCDGGVKRKLESLGFANVTNSNRDFYDDISKGHTPSYDVLVTNPPYSGVHMEKLLQFCADNAPKPYMLLLPHFVYTKDYYQRVFQAGREEVLDPFFLVPTSRYAYLPPKWVSESDGSKALARGREKTSPFPSFWYCCADGKVISNNWLTDKYGASGALKSKHRSGLRYAQYSKDIPRDFKGEFDTTKKRPNPKARKRAAAMKRR